MTARYPRTVASPAYGVTEDFIRIYKNRADMLVILLTLGHCFPGFSSFFGILNNDRLGF